MRVDRVAALLPDYTRDIDLPDQEAGAGPAAVVPEAGQP